MINQEFFTLVLQGSSWELALILNNFEDSLSSMVISDSL